MKFLKALKSIWIKIGGMNVSEPGGFDGVKFLNSVILIVFLLLLVFGSTKLGGLTEVEDII